MPVRSDIKKTIFLVNTSAHRNFMHAPHLGLLYVASFLKKRGFLPIYIDTGIKTFSPSSLIEQLKAHDPNIVGFSTDSDNYHIVLRLAYIIKEFKKSTKIILGGPHASHDDLELIKDRNVDVIVRDEGEYSCAEVADYYIHGKGSLSEIPGITYKKNNKPVKTPSRPPIDDLDQLPFPDYNFLPNKKNMDLNIITGRGCPHRCAFCSEGRSGGFKYHFRGAKNILQEVHSLLKLSPKKYLQINDDTFTASPKRVLEICRLFRENFKPGDDLIWFCEGRADDLSRYPEIIEEMVKAGMVRIQIGIESGCQEILNAYKKGITLDQIRITIKECAKARVPSIYGGFIIGGAFETEDTIKRTLKFAEELFDLAPGRFECNSTFLASFPGTEITRNPGKFGIKLLDKEMVTTFSLTHCINETEDLTKDKIIYWKNHFDFQIRSMINQRLSKLPNDIIKKHMELSEKGITTMWYEAVQSKAYPLWYFQTLDYENFRSFGEIDLEELFTWCPTRFPMQVEMEKGKIVLSGTIKSLKFNQLGTKLYELSSGKLTLEEIIKKIEGSYAGTLPPRHSFMKQVLDFYKHLDEEKVLLFKRL